MIKRDYEVTYIEYKSKAYEASLQLRNQELRLPLGMDLYSEDLSRDKSDIHIGSYDGDRLVGIAILSPVDKDVVQMRQVAVDQSYQKRGIGKALVKYIEDYAREEGFSLIILHARAIALSFYEQMNYEIIGQAFEEVGIQHFSMEKKIR